MPKSIPGWLDAPWNPDQTQNPDLAGNPQAWNALLANGERLPGLARIHSVKHALIAFPGRAGGRTPGAPTVRGREPGIASCSLTLLTNAEWAAYVEISPRLLPVVNRGKAKPGTAGAVQFYHPLLAAHGLRWCLVRDLEATSPTGGAGGTVRFTLEETQDPADVKVTQAKPKSTGLEAAPTIEIAGQAPRPPNLRDLTRKPATLAR